MSLFLDAATRIESHAIMKWKEGGQKVAGYTCSYVPPEIFHAAGILPVRLRGIETEGMEIGDAYFGPFICSFPKCILQLAGKDRFSFLDGVLITPGCDSMRRLDECWRKAGEDHEGIVPPWFYYFDVPHKAEVHGMNWFIQEIRNLIGSIEQHFGVAVTPALLKESIREYNRGRRLLHQVEELRSGDDILVSGTEVFAATIAGTVLPREQYNAEMEKWVDDLSKRQPLESGRKRLMVIGSISDEIDLFQLIENNMNAVVVAENLCFGVRFEGDEVSDEGDPVASLARHYLEKSVCPRMFGKYRERLSALKKKIKKSRVDGVIMQNIRFCDLHGSENGLFERDLEAEGVPCLKIEREYGPLTETGRMKLRINAFLERIS
jgi:bcr-type benzoyl-CoA reductase subunit C